MGETPWEEANESLYYLDLLIVSARRCGRDALAAMILYGVVVVVMGIGFVGLFLDFGHVAFLLIGLAALIVGLIHIYLSRQEMALHRADLLRYKRERARCLTAIDVLTSASEVTRG